MRKVLILIAAILLSGCAVTPWTDADHERIAKRYCGGLQNYDRHWGECKGRQGSMVGRTAAPVTVYGVEPGDEDAIRARGGVLWERE